MAKKRMKSLRNKAISHSAGSVRNIFSGFKKQDKKEHLFQIEVDAAMIIFSIIVVLTIILIFSANERNLVPNCSYLDPLFIDVAALAGSAFLIIEGMWSIVRSPASHAKQIFRLLRVLFAVGVLTMHVLQIKYG
ncbi:TPA: hypothetical protein HA246_04615 [Candidatus Woesearchaeota archaeon]|nr:hypothetical protein [Candidatus Woesearchaeota archaeon]